MEFVQLLKRYKYYDPARQTGKQKMICDRVIHAWSLCKAKNHSIAYMLDIRCTRTKMFMPGNSVDGVLALIKQRLNDDAEHWATEVEHTKWENHTAPYNTGLLILS